MFDDTKYMQMALKLAIKGIGMVEPNPAVGCLIVKDSQIIGKGWHKIFGGPHAEINAIADCKANGQSPSGATMYVTLEPCSHQGKTGPCCDAIIQAGITKVVMATVDPFEKLRGQGREILRQANIEVEVGLCEEQAQKINAPFFKYAVSDQPWIVLKWAQTLDGKLAWSPSAGQRWISNETSREDAHALRRRVQGIVVGINTIKMDDPELTARPSKGRTPARIVIDSDLHIPLDCKLIKTLDKAPVKVVTTTDAVEKNPDKTQRLSDMSIEVISVGKIQGRLDLHHAVEKLGQTGMQQLLIEGGPTLLAAFMNAGIGDEVRIYIAPKILGVHGAADISQPVSVLQESLSLTDVDIRDLDGDICLGAFVQKRTKPI